MASTDRVALAWRRWRTSSTTAGLLAWSGALAVLPAPLVARILLLGPLVIAPVLIRHLAAKRWLPALAGWPALVAAMPLLVAFALPPGPLAAGFALPWLAAALVATVAAISHGLANLGVLLRPRGIPALGMDVALGFWGIGALFILIDRLGLETGFTPTIVLLTATHFHFAGLGLLGLASLHAASRSWLRGPAIGLVVGMPITAAGFLLANDAISASGALLVGSSGIGVAIAFLAGDAPGAVGWVRRAAGIALLIGMPMGIAWSLAILWGVPFVDLDTMIRTHGVLNATGILLGVLSFRSST